MQYDTTDLRVAVFIGAISGAISPKRIRRIIVIAGIGFAVTVVGLALASDMDKSTQYHRR